MIHIRGLSIFYAMREVVRGVSLHVPTGKITALVGPSGCGKTSVLSALNRLSDEIPGARVEGQVLLGGEDIRAGMAPARLRRRVGMIFQKPNPFPLSIEENVQLALREHGERDRGRLAEKTRQALQDVGLWEEVHGRLKEPALELSGGQQQRLCIARALALKPEVLLMDEPCSALDPLALAVVENTILRLRGSYTIVIVTHHLAQARRIADELAVFWMQGGVGVLLESGAAAELFERPRDETTRAYLQGSCG